MQKRMILIGTLVVTAVALVASVAAPPRAEALSLPHTTSLLQCNQISCPPSANCNVDACGGAGFCGSSHHCIPL